MGYLGLLYLKNPRITCHLPCVKNLSLKDIVANDKTTKKAMEPHLKYLRKEGIYGDEDDTTQESTSHTDGQTREDHDETVQLTENPSVSEQRSQNPVVRKQLQFDQVTYDEESSHNDDNHVPVSRRVTGTDEQQEMKRSREIQDDSNEDVVGDDRQTTEPADEYARKEYSIQDVDAFLREQGFDIESAEAEAVKSALEEVNELSFLQGESEEATDSYVETDQQQAPQEEGHENKEQQPHQWLGSTRVVHVQESSCAEASSSYTETTSESIWETRVHYSTVANSSKWSSSNQRNDSAQAPHDVSDEDSLSSASENEAYRRVTDGIANVNFSSNRLKESDDSGSQERKNAAPAAGIHTAFDAKRLFGRRSGDSDKKTQSKAQSRDIPPGNLNDDNRDSIVVSPKGRGILNASDVAAEVDDRELLVSSNEWENVNGLLERNGYPPVPIDHTTSEDTATVSEADVLYVIQQLLEDNHANAETVQEAALSYYHSQQEKKTGSSINHSPEELTELRRHNLDLENRLKSATKEKESSVSRLRSALHNKEKELAATKRRTSSLEKELQEMKHTKTSRLSKFQGRVKELEAQLKEKDNEIKAMKTQNYTADTKVDNTSTSVESLKDTLDQTRRTIVERNKVIENLEASLKRKEDDFEKRKTELNNEVSRWKKETEHLKNEVDEAKKELKLVLREHTAAISKDMRGSHGNIDVKYLVQSVSEICVGYKKRLNEERRVTKENSRREKASTQGDSEETKQLRKRVEIAEEEVGQLRNSCARLRSDVTKYQDACSLAIRVSEGNQKQSNCNPGALMEAIKALKNQLHHLRQNESRLNHQIHRLKENASKTESHVSSGALCEGSSAQWNSSAESNKEPTNDGHEKDAEKAVNTRLKQLLRQTEARARKQETEIQRLKYQLSEAIRRSQGVWKSSERSNVHLTESLQRSIGDQFDQYTVTTELPPDSGNRTSSSDSDKLSKQNAELNKALKVCYSRLEEKDRQIDSLYTQLQRDRNRIYDSKGKDRKVTNDGQHLGSKQGKLEQRPEAMKEEIIQLRQINNALTDALTQCENRNHHRSQPQIQEVNAERYASRESKLDQIGANTAEEDKIAFPHLKAKLLEESRESLVDEVRKLRNREQDLENQINELKESYEKLSGENGDLRERYDNLYLELESRPTVHAWHEAQSQLQSLELEIQSAVEFGLNRERLQQRAIELLRESSDRRKLSSTRVLIAKDKRAHELGLKQALDNLPESNARRILKDCCILLSINDADALPAAIRSLNAVTKAIPAIEGFTIEICRLIQLYAAKRGEMYQQWKQFFYSLFNGDKQVMVPHFQPSRVNYDAAAGSDTFRSVLEEVDSILKNLDRLCLKDAFADVIHAECHELRIYQTLSSSKSLTEEENMPSIFPYKKIVQETDKIFAAIRYGDSLFCSMEEHKSLFDAAEGALKESDSQKDSRFQFLQSIVLYFQELFGVESLQGCFSTMNALYQFNENMKNFLTNLKHTIGEGDDTSLHQLLEKIEKLRESCSYEHWYKGTQE